MSSIIQYPFTNAGNYSFDSNLIEISGGKAKLKDLTPIDEIFYADYDLNINGSRGAGVLTGTPTGGAGVSGGELDLTGETVKYVNYDPEDNADPVQTGCVRFKVRPNYSGSPVSNKTFFHVVGVNSKNFVFMKHFTDGLVEFSVYNSAGVLIVKLNSGWVPVANNVYELEGNWDLTAGASRFFINGLQVGSTHTGTGTRDTNVTNFRVGSDRSGVDKSDFKIDDFQIFTTVQHTENFASEIPRASQQTYSLANPTIIVNATFLSSDWLTFTETSPPSGADEIKYTPRVNGIDKWFSGSLLTSDGTYAQSNTDDEISANIGDFVVARSSTGLKIFLHSDTGYTTPELDLVDITYNSSLPDPATPTLIELEGFVYTPLGVAVNTLLKIRPYIAGFVNEGVFMQYAYVDIGHTDSDGWFEKFVHINPSIQLYELKIGKQSYTIDLSDKTGLVDLSTLTLTLVTD